MVGSVGYRTGRRPSAIRWKTIAVYPAIIPDRTLPDCRPMAIISVGKGTHDAPDESKTFVRIVSTGLTAAAKLNPVRLRRVKSSKDVPISSASGQTQHIAGLSGDNRKQQVVRAWT
jgi:hypothetical protein